MYRIVIFIILFAVLIGCRVSSSEKSLPNVVGGAQVSQLLAGIDDAMVLGVQIDEVVVSNDSVTVIGKFRMTPRLRMVINPYMFEYVFARAILTLDDESKWFRLVSDNEFLIADYLMSKDQIYSRSSLMVGASVCDEFKFTYKGFPSDAIAWSDKENMSIVSLSQKTNKVHYIAKSCVGVRFSKQDYGYPNDDESFINVQGEGDCIMVVE